MEADKKLVETRRFEGMYKMIESNSSTKYEKNPENKEIFIYGFKQIETKKWIVIYQSDMRHQFFENDKLFNFCSNKFTNKEIEKKDFNITGWPFITLPKKQLS